MEQLEQFEFEKQYLLNQNLASQQEMKKLSEKYGNILGHQNNKQKIKHISKYFSLLFKTPRKDFRIFEKSCSIGFHVLCQRRSYLSYKVKKVRLKIPSDLDECPNIRKIAGVRRGLIFLILGY